MERTGRAVTSAVVAIASGAAVSQPVSAHVDYVTEPPEATVAAAGFLADVLATPFNLALVVGGTVLTVVGLTAHALVRPAVPDVAALRSVLAGYREYVPWMLRLSLGLPLVGAGFAGYLFSPAVPLDMRVFQVALGFLILCGLATRAVAVVGLLAYLGSVPRYPQQLLAMEYVPGFLALVLVGSGRPSADHMLTAVADTPGTWYGRIDPVHTVAIRFNRLVEPYARYVPTVLRVGIGVSFAYLGLFEKLAQPGRALGVVDKYDLTAVLPVDPGLWVVGAGLTEIGVGILLIAGYLTRATAAVAFSMLVLTLFGLPDDPVLAHVTLFGMLSAVFTLGSGPLSVDALFEETTRTDDGREAAAAD